MLVVLLHSSFILQLCIVDCCCMRNFIRDRADDDPPGVVLLVLLILLPGVEGGDGILTARDVPP